MRHVHSELIKALADNTELVKFVKACEEGAWTPARLDTPFAFLPSNEYYLCLPQHKEACLHWLNGGKVTGTYQDIPLDTEITFDGYAFTTANIFMQESTVVHIKPSTININGHEVPEPMRVKPSEGTTYYVVDLNHDLLRARALWGGGEYDQQRFKLGLAHLTEEAAIAHTKALLSFME